MDENRSTSASMPGIREYAVNNRLLVNERDAVESTTRFEQCWRLSPLSLKVLSNSTLAGEIDSTDDGHLRCAGEETAAIGNEWDREAEVIAHRYIHRAVRPVCAIRCIAGRSGRRCTGP